MANYRYFSIAQKKPVYSQWFVELDISNWLDGDTISNVDFSAIDDSTGLDTTDDILDMTKCIWDVTTGIIKPYIKGGSSDIIYKIQMKVQTTSGDKEIFWLILPVR